MWETDRWIVTTHWSRDRVGASGQEARSAVSQGVVEAGNEQVFESRETLGDPVLRGAHAPESFPAKNSEQVLPKNSGETPLVFLVGGEERSHLKHQGEHSTCNKPDLR